MGGLGGFEQVFRAGMGRAKGKVFADGRAEKEGLLGNHADVAPEHGQGIVAHRPAVDQQRALGRFVEPGDQVDQRGFARAGGADDGQAGAGGNVERDAAQNRRLAVAEIQIAELDLAAEDSIGRNRRIGGAVVDGRLGLAAIRRCA